MTTTTDSGQRPIPDPSQDLFREKRHPLDSLFAPRNVALIGATETPGSVGRTVLWNLLSNPFGGTVYPINPKRPSVLGIKTYPNIAAVPDKVDLAVIATPASTIPGIVEQCAAAGVAGAIIISAGFKELGPVGAELETKVLTAARKGKMRIIGPNCLGVMNTQSGLNATFAGAMAKPGSVAFLSQSGALCTAILDWSLREMVGFSAFVSVGSMLDVGWGDMIDYLGNDPRTKSILIYMETIGDARSFISAAREVALNKPIIVIKAGCTEAAARAAASHTGSLTGSDDVLNAAFRRAGVLRVSNISDLFYMAETLARQPRPRGPRLTILTNAGGPAVLATDALIGGGGELAPLSVDTVNALNILLPAHWSHNNPIDILGDASPDRYARSIEIAAKDPDSDGLLVVLTPQDMSEPTLTAEAIKTVAKKVDDRPVIASWMGGPSVQAGEEILNRAGIPTYPYPDTAARVFTYMWRYTYNLRAIYETPIASAEGDSAAPALAAAIIAEAGASGRVLLDEEQSKRLLSSYGIPVVQTEVAASPDEAVAIANRIGYPVVLKVYSHTITHKTDVGGVKLNLASADAVRAAFTDIKTSVSEKAGIEHFQGVAVQTSVRISDGYELILGSSVDPQFGPVLLFGTGGQLVEVFKDRALGLPPLNATLARRMMESTHIYRALQGVRGRKGVDLPMLEQVLVKLSRLVTEHPRIKEIDINPLLVTPTQIVALDARVVLFSADTPDSALPKAAIRPYPTQYVRPWTSKTGEEFFIRPIRPEDEPLMVKMHQTLSERSVQLRYFHPMKLTTRTSHDRLSRICCSDYDRDMVLIALHQPAGTDAPVIAGVGRLSKMPGGSEAEFAVLVVDAYQHRGLGSELLSRVLEMGRDEHVGTVAADVLSDNQDMQSACKRLGFTISSPADGVVRASIELT